MKKLITMIMFMAFLVMPVSVNAGACERYWDGLVGQTFAITVNKVEFTVYFNVQVVDGILYEAEISINLSYSTTSEYVIVEGLLFALSDGQLILLPEDPWIFDIVEEDIL
jgi:hypothetical protein